MVNDIKLAKYLLENGSLDKKIKSVISDTLSKHLLELNTVTNRRNMIYDVEYHLMELGDELGIQFNVTSEEELNKLVYHIHYLDKKITFTAPML
jgi:hypothetical protein